MKNGAEGTLGHADLSKQFMKGKAPYNPPSLVCDRFMSKKSSGNEGAEKFAEYSALKLKQEEFKWRGVVEESVGVGFQTEILDCTNFFVFKFIVR